MPNNDDIQMLNLIRGLNELLETVSDSENRELLDINSSSEAHAWLITLARLKNSLEQYNKKKRHLFYVGFIGHFSAGKSSTINSLLSLWDSGRERSTDLNPTDQHVTLLTSPKNEYNVVPPGGGNLSLVLNFHEHEMLNEIVFADTPGQGDPLMLEDIVEDFLPVCDLLLYFLGAPSALDKADLPILDLLFKRMPFIPMELVVTRADEFRVILSSPVSDENIDKEKLIQFKTRLLDRLHLTLEKQGIKGRTFNPEDVIVIDNKPPRYNIDFLKEKISKMVDQQESDWRVKAHGHRINYFLRYVEEIRNFFSKVLNEKVETWSGYFNETKKHIEKYDSIVNLAHHDIPQAWTRFSRDIFQMKENFLEKFDSTPHPFSNTLSEYLSSNDHKKVIEASLLEELEWTGSKIQRNIEEELKPNLADHFREFLGELGSNEDLGENIKAGLSQSLLEPPSFHFKPNLQKIVISLKRSLADHTYGDPSSAYKITEKIVGDVKTRYRSLNRSAQPYLNDPVQKFSDQAEKELDEAVRRFLGQVDMYKSTTISMKKLEFIRKLGTFKEFIILDREFTEEEQKKKGDFAKEAILKELWQLQSKYSEDISRIHQDLQSMKMKVNELTLPKDEYSLTFPQNLAPEIIQSELIEASEFLAENINNIIRSKISNLSNRMAEMVMQEDAKVKSEIRKNLVKKIIYPVSLVFVVFLVIGLAIYLDYVDLGNAAESMIISIVGSSFVVGCGFIIKGFFKENSSLRAKSQTELNSEIIKNVEQELEDILKTKGLFEIRNEKIKSVMKEYLSKHISKQQLELNISSIAKLYDEARTLLGSIIELEAKFSKILSNHFEEARNFFSDPVSRMEKLTKISDGIKSEVIDPKQAILDKLHQKMVNLEGKIDHVSFIGSKLSNKDK